jgi:septum site-determining protein MinC
MAFSVLPRPPIAERLSDLDVSLERSNGFFSGYPVALDLSAVTLSPNGVRQLVADLEERNIRILGLEGIEPADLVQAPGLPPVLRPARNAPYATPLREVEPVVAPPAPAPAAASKPGPASLLIEDPVRSGQTVIFIEGDVTVLGSVGSGAEIVAGGSIHIYGTLRGRAMAGASGNGKARIFCHRVEAELLAIDSYYKTADEIEESLRNGPAQAWLEGQTLRVSALN